MKNIKTQVAIIGSGPSGLLLGQLLAKQNIDNIIIERTSKEHILSRIRAGVLETGAVNLVREAGVSHNIDKYGIPHHAVEIAINDERVKIELTKLTGGDSVVIYGQVNLTEDLMNGREGTNLETVYLAQNVKPNEVTSEIPYVTYSKDGIDYRLECDYIAGCDGYHGVSRHTIPQSAKKEYEKTYPFGWLGLLSETPPANDELIYCNSDRGFALCSMRSATRSRYYIQVSNTDKVENWSDEAFWEELSRRIPESIANNLITGPSIEKSIAPLRSFICEPLQYGKLFLVGDAGHIVPPTGAKGLNLAASDVAVLYQVLTKVYREGDKKCIEKYSDVALRRVWNAARFSWWMTNMTHDFRDNMDEFNQKITLSEIKYFLNSEAGRKIIAQQYVGLAYENIE